jgi:hypothetical protein
MPKESAQELGFWGLGCRCCGGGADTTGDTWQFDTELKQTAWYFE